MKAYVNENFYHFLFNGDRDVLRLSNREIISPFLQEEKTGDDLGKKVMILLSSTPENKGIEVTYDPKDSTFEELKSITIALSHDTYHKLLQERSVTFREGSSTFRFEITNTDGLI